MPHPVLDAPISPLHRTPGDISWPFTIYSDRRRPAPVRYYGLLAGGSRKASLALARELLSVAAPPDPSDSEEPDDFHPPCPCCGGRMIVIEV